MALASNWPAMTAMLPKMTNRRIVDLNRFIVAILSTFDCPSGTSRQELVNLICLGVSGGAWLVPPAWRLCLRAGAPELAEFSVVRQTGLLVEALWSGPIRPSQCRDWSFPVICQDHWMT